MNEFYDDSPEVLRALSNMRSGGFLKPSVKLYIVFPENSRTPKPVVESYATWRVPLLELHGGTSSSNGKWFCATYAVITRTFYFFNR